MVRISGIGVVRFLGTHTEDLDGATLDGAAHRRPCHTAWLTNSSWRASQIATHRISIDAHLARDAADGNALDEVSVANNVDLFHSEHPPSERPASDGTQVVEGEFWRAERVSFERRDHEPRAHFG